MDKSTDSSTSGGDSENSDVTNQANSTNYPIYIDTDGATGGSVTYLTYYDATDVVSYDEIDSSTPVFYADDYSSSAGYAVTPTFIGGYFYITCNLTKEGYNFVGWAVTNTASHNIIQYGTSSSNCNSVSGNFTYYCTDSPSWESEDRLYFYYNIIAYAEDDGEELGEELGDDEELFIVDSVTPLFTALWAEDTSVDLGVYSELEDEDGNQVQYWISDTTYFSTDWLTANAGTESDPYIIDSAEDLAGLSYLVFTGDYTFLDCYFTQTCDIDLSGTDYSTTGLYWMPIGRVDVDAETLYSFMGNYDGGGFTISNMVTYYDEDYEDLSIFNCAGLFGIVAATDYELSEQFGTASIQNVVINNSTISGYSTIATIVGCTVCVEIENCSNINSNVTGNDYVGGICGQAVSTTFKNCCNKSSVTAYGSESYCGGLVAVALETNIKGCYNQGEITATYDYHPYVGGIAAYVDSTSINECYNLGDLVAYDGYVGGIVGEGYNYTKIYNSFNTGDILGSGEACGGIIGGVQYETTIWNCYNTGKVSGHSSTGGIVGGLMWGDIVNCFNVGDVTCSTNVLYIGGVVGYFGSDNSTISNCYYGECTITDGDGATYQKGIGYNYYDYSTKAEGVDEEGVTEYLSGISSLAKTKSWYTSSDNWDATYPWDMTSTWVLNANYNSGYPILKSLLTSYAEYDSTGDFWYILDGYMPQSVYGTDGQTAPSDVDASAASEAYTIRLSTSSWAQVEIFSGTDDDYAYVTIYSGSNVEVASAWFVVEPIVWIVAYGEDAPTSVTCAVTAKIVTAGYIYSNAGTSFSWAMSSVLGMSVETLESYMGLSFASVGDFAYDSFSGTLSQLAVTDNATTLSSKIAVSSVDEIDALGGSYASTCTDFVAFLLSNGSSTDGDSYSADYWTRDLAASLDSESTYGEYTSVAQLNNGVYVTKDGTLNNAKLSTLMGARLTMNV